jgi:UDP-N-acetylmuramoylalanine--D-glutamate ligase
LTHAPETGGFTLTDGARSKILVLGLGLSGMAAAELAARQGAAVTVLDAGASVALRERAESLASRGVDVRLEWHAATWTSPVDLVIISPGIPHQSALGQLARRFECPLISELEYGFRFCSCPILAISGTNGKTTTTELVTHCLKHAGRRVLAAGNIGKPLCEAAARSGQLDFLVVEVSSFQLEHTERFAPLAAALLNVTPDHLDRYADFDDYCRTKLRLFRNVPRADHVVLREDLLELETVRAGLPRDGSTPVAFTSRESLFAGYFLSADNVLCRRTGNSAERLMASAELKLRGLLNVEYVLAALALCELAGVPPREVAAHARGFVPGAHRLEVVAVHNGVRFVNDSKATNLDALRQSIAATVAESRGRVCLIAGGVDKGVDFAPIAPLLEKHVSGVFLIGRCRERLAKQWGHAVSCKVFASLAAAVNAAAESAASGDTVLLAPGCASQDMFTDYAERGREFCNLVKRRAGE